MGGVQRGQMNHRINIFDLPRHQSLIADITHCAGMLAGRLIDADYCMMFAEMLRDGLPHPAR